MATSTTTRSSAEERALKLLGSGLGPEAVASAVGVTVSRISQLLSDSEFAAEVSTLRYNSLSKHNERDETYDTLEDALITKLKQNLPLMCRPMEILKAIQVINAAKRRGQSAPESITNQQTVVNITMPTQIVNKFTTNINNQVVQAGSQELLTIQASKLKDLSTALAESVVSRKELGNENVTRGNESLIDSL